MHPPLFKPHPLCKQVRPPTPETARPFRSLFRPPGPRGDTCSESDVFWRCCFAANGFFMQEVQDLVKCHDEHPFLKFFNACGSAKVALDACFKVRYCARARRPHGSSVFVGALVPGRFPRCSPRGPLFREPFSQSPSRPSPNSPLVACIRPFAARLALRKKRPSASS